jgi:hypothetical protein
MDKLDKSNAIKVKCVRDEYMLISHQLCENCNKKYAYKLCTQQFLQDENGSYDVLDTQCQYCGHKKCFTFNITEYHEDVENQIQAMFKDKDKFYDLDWDSET